MNSLVVEQRLDAFRTRCQERGIPLTPQRRTVMEVLAPRTDHPTVEQVHTEIVQKLPGVSKATVYRTLETLTQVGLLRRVHHEGSAIRFDPNTIPHHHFLCTVCGTIRDLERDAVQGFDALTFQAPEGVKNAELVLTVRGECATCNSAGQLK